MRDRVVGIERVRAGDLVPSARNWRRHPERQRRVLKGIIKEVGFAVPLLAWRRPDGRLELVDGHLRADTSPDAILPVAVLDVDEHEAGKLLLAVDPISALAEQDDAALRGLLDASNIQDADVLEMLHDLLGDDPGVEEDLSESDDVTEPSDDPWVERGDMFALGNHRLLCGDSTSEDDLARLMGGDLASMVWTDPPWNVGYEGGAKKRKAIENDDLGDAFGGFLSAAFGGLAPHVLPGAPTYVAMSSQEWGTLMTCLSGAGFRWSSTIIWAKDSMTLSRKDYHPQYEPIWYGWRDGAPRLVQVADRTQTDLWRIERPKKSDDHPTMKPVELVRRAIENSSVRGAIVAEPFSGSGSTLIACEESGRACRAMELDPGYVQSTIERWERLTGRKAEKL